MKKLLPFIFLVSFLSQTNVGICQNLKMRPLDQLINTTDSGWVLVIEWIKNAKNDIEVLETDSTRADSSLFNTQVTTRSPMGAIIYKTGGILVDHGWIRILGSGSTKMERTLPEWNKGKSFQDYGQAPSFLLIADDAIGGFFALNGGAFGNVDLGKIYYLSPDYLEWESLDIGYSDFILWAFSGNLDEFYQGLRWSNWEKEVKEMKADRVINFFPYLWTEYEKIEDLSRKDVPIEEVWKLHTK